MNDLLAISESPTCASWTEALVCNLLPGRRKQGPAALKELKRASQGARMERQDGKLGSPAGRATAFFTDSTICIGCKACEVACKEWNGA